MQTFLQRLTSRKFLVSTASALVIIFGEQFGLELDPEAVAGLVGVTASFVFGEAIIDKQRLKALVGAEVEQFKVQANLKIASLTQQLRELQAAPEGGE